MYLDSQDMQYHHSIGMYMSIRYVPSGKCWPGTASASHACFLVHALSHHFSLLPFLAQPLYITPSLSSFRQDPFTQSWPSPVIGSFTPRAISSGPDLRSSLGEAQSKPQAHTGWTDRRGHRGRKKKGKGKGKKRQDPKKTERKKERERSSLLGERAWIPRGGWER